MKTISRPLWTQFAVTKFFEFKGRLDAGTYYLKVTGRVGTETGRYTVRAIVDGA